MGGLNVSSDIFEGIPSWPNGMAIAPAPNAMNLDLTSRAFRSHNTKLGGDDPFSSETWWRPPPRPQVVSAHVNPNDVSLISLGTPPLDDTPNQYHTAYTKSRRNSCRGRRKKAMNANADDLTVSNRLQVLTKNREAANRYRLRQKDYVKNLERRCRNEREKRRALVTLVRSLEHEVLHLKNALVKQSTCNCSYIQDCTYWQAAWTNSRPVCH